MTNLTNEPKPPSWRLTQGVLIERLRAGDPAGKPIEEPAHITPRYPHGIRNSDLIDADQSIKLETALWWFALNFERYDPSKNGPYSGFPEGLDSGPT